MNIDVWVCRRPRYEFALGVEVATDHPWTGSVRALFICIHVANWSAVVRFAREES